MDVSAFPEAGREGRGPRRWPRLLGLVAVGVLALVGPWPVDDGSYRGADYEARTLGRLAAMPGPTPPGPIRIGVAEVDLTPLAPVPLAGFVGRIGMRYDGVDAPCSARALTIASGPRATTILAVDLLFVDAELAGEVLRRARLAADEVFFTASHSHAAPGGWGRHPLERLVAGDYDPAVFAMLAGRLSDVIRRSRVDLVPAEMATVEARPPGRQVNRIVPGGPTHDALSALAFRPAGATADAPPLALLTVFGAHATIVRTDPPRLSADYPGALVAALKERAGAGMVLFAAGAVGDASPARPRLNSTAKAARAFGSLLADDLLAVLPRARYSAEVAVDRLRLDVDLPPVRLPFFSARLRFSPAATWWIADRRTHLDALRVGPAVLVGFPGDASGHLAGPLVDAGRRSDLTPVVTSFNGDYRGYFVSRDIFRDRPCYETRWMSFYGPWAGDYLAHVAARMVDHLAGAGDPRGPGDRGGRADDPAHLLAAALALPVLVVAARRGRAAARAAATVAIGLAAASAIAPDWLDWSRFGLPPGARWTIGPALGLLSLAGPRRGWGPARAALAWAASAVLTAVWPIALVGAWSLLARAPARPEARAADHQSK